MNVLFLISSPGKGHTRCAEAIDAALRNRHPGEVVESRHLDIHDLIDARVSAALKEGYLRMIAEQPSLYQRLYDLDVDVYRQLSGEIPADSDIAGFLAEQQRRWFPEGTGQPRRVASRWNLDVALFNALVNGVRDSWRFPPNRIFLKGLLQLIYRMLAKRLEEAVRSRCPDVVVATQMYPCRLLRRAIESGDLKQPLVGVITDYGVHGIWIQQAIRHYCVGHSSTARMLADRGIPAERIRVTGIPLMPAFANPPGQAEARARLGLDERPTVLITGGEYGIGTVDAVHRIIDERPGSLQVLVTAHSTTPGYHELESLAQDRPDALRLYAWTDDMAVLMCAADLVMGKPGGLTVSESLACGRPFVATCSLGGQEGHNIRFLEKYAIGGHVPPERLVPYLRTHLGDRPALAAWQARARREGRRLGADAVADVVESRVRPRPRMREAVS